MDFREDWFIYDNTLINDINNFSVSIELAISKDGTPESCPIHIEAGGIGFILNVYDRDKRERTECVFSTLDDLTFFINGYITRCKNIMDVATSYNTYCCSEDVCRKGYIS